MERQYLSILNTIHQEVVGKPIDTDTYNVFVKSLRVDRSPANIARIKESLIIQKINLEKSLTSPENRTISLLHDETITLNKIQDTTEKKLLCIAIIKNAEKTFGYITDFIEAIKPYFAKVNFYFLTNNNIDNTEKVLTDYIQSTENDSVFGTFANDFIPKDKTQYLATLRNKCYTDARQRFTEEHDYLVVIDSNISSALNVQGFMTSFALNREWDIICGNRTFQKSPYHQDVYSLRFLNESLNLLERYKYLEKFYGESLYWVDKFYSFETWQRVQSAFGGILICNKKVFKLTSLWNETPGQYESEHVSLCTKFINVYVNPLLNHQSDINVEGILYHDPYIFIPRDAGFFSVFNYLIGSITNGYRVYPYYNKSKCLEKNKFINHFSYLDDSIENSWFKYFEPIQYFADDNTHSTQSILLYNTTQGEYAPNEFKYPSETMKIFKHESFVKWRIEVNKYFVKYIKPLNVIRERVIELKKKFNGCKNVIGILYRHPAHNCENKRTILFQDYFDKIDDILSKNSDAIIYLTTDTDLGIGAFISRYGDKVIYDERSGRTSFDNIIKWAMARGTGKIDSIGFINDTGYEYHNECCNKIDQVKHGQDILTNTYVLSSCKWFIYPQSNISLAISYMNPEIEMISVIDD